MNVRETKRKHESPMPMPNSRVISYVRIPRKKTKTIEIPVAPCCHTFFVLFYPETYHLHDENRGCHWHIKPYTWRANLNPHHKISDRIIHRLISSNPSCMESGTQSRCKSSFLRWRDLERGRDRRHYGLQWVLHSSGLASTLHHALSANPNAVFNRGVGICNHVPA